MKEIFHIGLPSLNAALAANRITGFAVQTADPILPVHPGYRFFCGELLGQAEEDRDVGGVAPGQG